MLVQYSQILISLLNTKEPNLLTTERYPFKRLMISIIIRVIPIISNELIVLIYNFISLLTSLLLVIP